MEPLEAEETARLWPGAPRVKALKLSYFNVDGRIRKDVYRLRLLEDPPPGPFGEVPEKRLRYLQPPGTPVAAYLPPSVDWEAVARDPTQPILITEGEKKAAVACKHGLACVGLGGVSSWRSAAKGWDLLPELGEVVWSGRDVTIIFDSDAATNPSIAAATVSLCRALMRRGASPGVAAIPPGEPEEDGTVKKVGLDDLVLAKGIEGLNAVLQRADGDELAARLWEFNTQYAMIDVPGMIYDLRLDHPHEMGKWKTYLAANVRATQRVVTETGAVKLKSVSVAEEWVKWDHRRQHSRLTYRPGGGRVVGSELNCWPGLAVQPVKGDLKLWRALIDHLFIGEDDPNVRRWFESWCLYPLKHLGTKMPTCVGIWSNGHGRGKSTLGKLLGKIYGRNYSEVGQNDLERDFNGWHAYKQFILLDDVSAFDSRTKADKLKKVIAEDDVQVNIKGIATFQVPDHANFMLTSNHATAFYIEDDDRRYFVHECVAPRSKELFDAVYKWMGGTKAQPALGPGPAAILHHAMHEHDFGGFDPFEAPPLTRAKAEMTRSVKSELDAWVAELVEAPETKLVIGGARLERDVFTAKELLAFYDLERKGSPIAPNVMGARLRAGGLSPPVGKVIRPNGEQTERMFVVRNRERWERATSKQIADHVREMRARETGKGRY